ncbi:hypothetical protein AB204_16075 [Xenorhabdus khoisanae]|uniref:Uncharacterized protein n=1 Tax=Xenorhabdus khoisanae TaxID=880157 RepID=A0A0J5FQ96_9GAMM|nr:hypothetical protein AB204_16075 [Xenorhabdus khoisanae]
MQRGRGGGGKRGGRRPTCLQGCWPEPRTAAKDEGVLAERGTVLDGCLVLIPDSEDTCAIKQQYRRQQEQFSDIKLRMRELIGDYKSR